MTTEPLNEYVTSVDGTPIGFERHGRGPVLVLVEPPLRHRAHSAYAALVPLLAEHLTVVGYDRRGRGDSGDAPEFHPDRESEDLASVIGAVGGSAHVYGFSAGAVLALRAATTTSGIRGLVVLEPPLHDADDPIPDPLTIELAALIDRGDRARAVVRFHEAIGVPDEFVAAMRTDPSWSATVDIAHTLVYDCRISDATDRHTLRGIQVPTLVLDSAGSGADLTGWAADVAALIPGASHRSLPGEWHTVADEVLAPVIVDHVLAARGRG